MVELLFITYISVHVAHHEIFNAKFGKAGVKVYIGFKPAEISFQKSIFVTLLQYRPLES